MSTKASQALGLISDGGPPNTGKTYLMTSLYQRALLEATYRQVEKNDFRDSVWRVNATELMNQTVAWSLEQGKEFKDWKKNPVVTPQKIALAIKDGYRPRLFLDELDKVAATDFKLSGICDLVDLIYAAEGQIVATMNKSSEELAVKWGSDEAGTIVRRIGGGARAHTILFKDLEPSPLVSTTDTAVQV